MNRYLAFVVIVALGTSGACSKKEEDPSDSSSGSGGAASGAGTGAGSGAGSGTGSGGSSGGGSGSTSGSAVECVNQGEINFDCPFNLPPISGSCAPTGSCCQRASNNAKMAALGPDEPAELEYRLNVVQVTNHPATINHPVLMMSAKARADICSGEQCLLWRFTVPRQGGQLVPGPAKVEIGIGAYNCDGTYSFYGPNAAPVRDGISNDKGRWQSTVVDAQFDPAKEGMEQFHIPWVTNKNREIARSIFLEPADNSIDWELASSGFEITQFDTSEAGRDCMGERVGLDWDMVDGFVSYSPIVGNDVDVSNLVMQQYCQILAFGITNMKTLSCTETERCMPGSDGCVWVKLPDSLCPTSADERALFGCHLGAEGNVNQEEGYPTDLGCTPEAPTSPLDPDNGATSVGQCCDPLGQSSTLPACNAYRTVQEFVAAAAEITSDPRDELPPVCQ